MKNDEIVYKQVQFIGSNDTRSFDERHASLPFVRDEDLPEWENWWNLTLSGLNPNKNVSNY